MNATDRKREQGVVDCAGGGVTVVGPGVSVFDICVITATRQTSIGLYPEKYFILRPSYWMVGKQTDGSDITSYSNKYPPIFVEENQSYCGPDSFFSVVFVVQSFGCVN